MNMKVDLVKKKLFFQSYFSLFKEKDFEFDLLFFERFEKIHF